ncbi:hypothetical protein P7K49_004155, partial [Saguinus oedipus]
MPSRAGFSKAEPWGPVGILAYRLVVRARSPRRRAGTVPGLPGPRPSRRRRAQGASARLPPPTRRNGAPLGSAPHVPARRPRRPDSPGTLP